VLESRPAFKDEKEESDIWVSYRKRCIFVENIFAGKQFIKDYYDFKNFVKIKTIQF
jgi:hypothetical protein